MHNNLIVISVQLTQTYAHIIPAGLYSTVVPWAALPGGGLVPVSGRKRKFR